MKTIISLFVLMSMSITGIYGQQKEDVYISPSPGKFPGYWMITFKIIDENPALVKSIRYDVGFSYKNKKIKYIYINTILDIQKGIGMKK